MSNIANIQAPIYEAFGHVELLPWVAVGFSALMAATLPLWRSLIGVFPLKSLFVFAYVLTLLGAVVAGAAPNIKAVIVGRALTGVGAAGWMLM